MPCPYQWCVGSEGLAQAYSARAVCARRHSPRNGRPATAAVAAAAAAITALRVALVVGQDDGMSAHRALDRLLVCADRHVALPIEQRGRDGGQTASAPLEPTCNDALLRHRVCTLSSRLDRESAREAAECSGKRVRETCMYARSRRSLHAESVRVCVCDPVNAWLWL